MIRNTLLLLALCVPLPAWATVYYLAPASASPAGNDSNSGTSASAPWLTPNHSLSCGDVILATAGTYDGANFNESHWGTVSCPGNNNVAWLKCATFDACKINSTADFKGVWIDKSYWGIQGWEVTIGGSAIETSCFQASPNTATPAEIHHIIFANNVANGCEAAGFGAFNQGTTASVDYLVIVGNIAYNGARGTNQCGSGISVYQPIASDSAIGTHIFISGNFSYGNFDPATCAGTASTDGEGFIVDTPDFSQGGGTPYTQAIVVDNNIAVDNGSMGFLIFNNSAGTSGHAPVYFRNNTSWGNLQDPHESKIGAGEMSILTASNTNLYGNIAQASMATGLGGNTLYGVSMSGGDNTDTVATNWITGFGGSNNTFLFSSGTFAYGSNTLGTSSAFASPSNPAAPSCGSASSVPNCMATVIANFTPTAPGTSSYGYHTPGTASIYDGLYPNWLCYVTGFPSGLVTPGCGAGGTTVTPVAQVVFTGVLSSNANASSGSAPQRKQLGNCATGYSGGSLQPTGVPVGQLYCTTANQTSGEGAGGPTQGVVSATSSGTGIAAVTNGFNAGGSDSPVTLTDTYGGTGNDTFCTSDPHANDPSQVSGITLTGCVASSSATFGESTATGFGNSDVLFPTSWNATGVDNADHAIREMWFRVNNTTTLWDLEFDTNYNSSTGIYYGWGFHWNKGVNMFQYCPQDCSGWNTVKLIDPTGANPTVTSYSLTQSHVYHVRVYMSRGSTSVCTYNSTSNCFFYDKLYVEDVTAATGGVLYNIVDATTGLPAGGIPVNHNTWTENYVTIQTQVDMVTAAASTSVDIDSDTTVFYYLQPASVPLSLWSMDFNSTSNWTPNLTLAPNPTKPYAVLRVHDSGADLADIFGMTTTSTCDPVSALVYTGCNWAAFDHWVAQANAASAVLMYTFHKTPNFAGTYTSSPPNDTYFVNMLKAMVNRAGCTAAKQVGCIRYWEVWNEPNNDGGTLSTTSSGVPYWSGSIENLVHLARLVHDHVKTPANGGVDGIDPYAMVIGPGSAGWGTYTNLSGGALTVSGACNDATWNANLNSPEAFICEYLRRAGSGSGDKTGAFYTDAVSTHLYPNATVLSTIAESNIQTRVNNIKQAFTDLGITLCPHGSTGNGAGWCTQLFASENSWGAVSSGTYPRIGPDATNSAQVSGTGLTGSWADDQAAYMTKEHVLAWSLGLDLYTWYGWDFQNGWGNLFCTSSNVAIGCDLASSGNPSYPYQQKTAWAYGGIEAWMLGKTQSVSCTADGNSTWSCTYTAPYNRKSTILWNSAQTGVALSTSGYATQRTMYGIVTGVTGTVTPNYYPVVIERPANVTRVSGGWQ